MDLDTIEDIDLKFPYEISLTEKIADTLEKELNKFGMYIDYESRQDIATEILKTIKKSEKKGEEQINA